jgi:hypothetical protein
VLAAPAETSGADGKGGAFFLAELVEEGLHDGKGLVEAVVDGEGEIVAKRDGKVKTRDE